MIPKTIHYCWFGGNPLSQEAKSCIESWKKYCPDYEIICWDEKNFDISSNQFAKEAYDAKKWAYVTDYVRLYVLYNYGGIYMDSDVEVIRPLDEFLTEKAFSGFQDERNVPTGLMASEKGHLFVRLLLSDYDNLHYDPKDLSTNVDLITKHFVEYGLVQNNTKQTIEDFTLFPQDYFCAKDSLTRVVTITENTYTIHHFAASWVPLYLKFKIKVRQLVGPNITKKIVALKKKLIKVN